MRIFLWIFLTLSCFCVSIAQEIKINQIGFYKNSFKTAIIPECDVNGFEIFDFNTDQSVYSGTLSAAQSWDQSGEANIKKAIFSDFTQTGKFYIKAGANTSHPFIVDAEGVFKQISVWSTKAFFLWRASSEIKAEYATFNGIDYSRKMGHPDELVYIHSSAASESNPEGSVISSPKGWYDAGDYNKYVVNANPAVFSLLQAYEMYPKYYNELDLNIPESGNSIPDILDEVKWEIDWLLTMQDSTDGGVYTKLTTKNFSGMVLPENATATRYVVKKSTAAALDFASMLAKASRVYAEFETEFPGFSAQCLTAARKAYKWASDNPSIYFNNPSDIKTGQYGDNTVTDEFFQAQIELFLATKESSFIESAKSYSSFGVPSWPSVSTFGLIALVNAMDTIEMDAAIKQKFSEAFFKLADDLASTSQNSPYNVPINSFFWGSNGYAAGMGMILMTAYNLTEDDQYLQAGLSTFDYLLGRNATPYCFVTGFGSKSPKHIHCRRSEADNIAEPLPGYLAGGPNPSNQSSDCGTAMYPSTYGAKSYLDESCSYSTNEIAINWNGPLAFLAGSIEATLSDYKLKPSKITTDATGRVIEIIYSEPISNFTQDQLSCTVLVDEEANAVDSIKLNTEKTALLVYLADSISATDNNISISMNANNIATVNGNLLASFDSKAVMNSTKGAAPVIQDIRIDTSGLNIIISFSKDLKEIDTINTNFSVTKNEEDAFKTAYINPAKTNELIVSCDQLYKYDAVEIAYSGTLLVAEDDGIVADFAFKSIPNNAPESPSKLISAATLEDGKTIVLSFDKTTIVNSETEIASIKINQNGTETSAEITGSYSEESDVYLMINVKLLNEDSITISSIEGGLSTNDGSPIIPFSNISVSNNTPVAHPAVIIDSTQSVTIEAEDYNYNHGFEPEKCSDENGGQNLGYTDVGDWTEYTINVTNAGTYTINARIASNSKKSTILFESIVNGEVNELVKVNTPETGGWQKWQTVSELVDLSEGEQTLRLYAENDLFNINWISFEYGEHTTGFKNQNLDIKLYPNPCYGSAWIENSNSSEAEVSIYSTQGLLIDQFIIGTEKHEIDKLKEGAYIIALTNEQGELNHSILIVQ